MTRLQELTGQDEKMRRDCLQMLEILTDNRALSVNIQEAYDKLHIDIEKLPSYQKGM
ncbi:hypothetical protein GO003_009865 [Methylicorpusculum oleiharenae]|uniref:hypothetical protein n=1 Tax=Methylicorpusculum oleiharenae TaxID=1338687 RepID=UPI001E34F373|nr:hypothetical protein [Methylicorpusculum oleiharenae]MCD2450697.1 hypothetical protein [Methylicorpusculum oleiharenae]